MKLDTVLVLLAFVMPLAFAIRIRTKVLAICLGAVWFWFLMVVGALYNLATDPAYDSFAPAISIVFGWLPGLIYTSLCVLVVVIVSRIYVTVNSRNQR